MADEVLGPDQRRAIILIKVEQHDPSGEAMMAVLGRANNALREAFGDDLTPYLADPPVVVAQSRMPFYELERHISGWTLDPTEEEMKVMGLIKHGEGAVVPENEQQKQGSKEGLSQEAYDEIVAEGREGDGDED